MMKSEDKILMVDKEDLVVLTEDFEVIDAIGEFPDSLRKECYAALEKDKEHGMIMVFSLKTPPVIIVLFKFVKAGQEGLILVASREKLLLSKYLDALENYSDSGEMKEDLDRIRQILKALNI